MARCVEGYVSGSVNNRVSDRGATDDSVAPRQSSIDVREATGATPSALLSAVMATASSALLLADAAGVIITANPAFELVAGLVPKDVAGRTLSDLLAPGQEAQARAAQRAVLRGQIWQGDASIVARDGMPLALRIKMTPVLGALERVSHLVVEIRDAARPRVLSAIDPEVQTLGRLSSSIAHDFNNQLSVIINYTHILSRQIPKDSGLQAHLHDMQTTAWRATKLAQQLIVLGRRPLAEPQPLNLNQVIITLAPLLRTMLGDDVTLRTTLYPALWSVQMALPQAEQVLVNLAVNARDAMAGAGEVELTTENVTLSDTDPERPAELAPGRYVRFSLSERAALAAPSNDTDVSSSFPTPVDAITPMTGLGPSMIYRAVQQAGGSLALLADDNGGTTFRIHVPALDEAAPADDDSVEPTSIQTLR